MQSIRHMEMQTSFRKIVLFGVALVMITGGAACQKAPPAPSKPAARTPSKSVDAQMAQQYYDRGVQEYSKENYEEAKTLFQRAIDLTPNKELGLKAQENLKKTQQILRTLDKLKTK